MKAFIAVLLCACAVFAEEGPRKLYNGDKVVRIRPTTEDHMNWLTRLQAEADPHFHDFWTDPVAVNVPVDLHLNREVMDKFHADAQGLKMNYTIEIPDLQELINESEVPTRMRLRREARTGTRATIVGTFAKYDEIVSWCNSMAAQYPTLASTGSLGKTSEGRDLRYIKIGAAGSGKKEIFIEAGIHAREWLAPATTIYIIDRFLTTYNTDPAAKRLLDKYDFMIVPSANPDGYEYSRTERLWRKTRSKTSSALCYGVDPNRNYDIYWSTSGSSNQPCSDIYHGPKAFSEPETKAVSDTLKARKSNTLAFFAIHTYSQMWLIPYANKKGNYAPNYSELLRVGQIGTNALQAVNGKKWDVGNTVDVLSAAAGGSDDYAVSIGIKYSYTLELRPASNTANGFIVKETEIDPSGREVWAGLVAAIDAMTA